MPLPSPDTTPPVTKMCLVMPRSLLVRPAGSERRRVDATRHQVTPGGTAKLVPICEGFCGAGVAPVLL